MTRDSKAQARGEGVKRALLVGVRTYPNIPEAYGQPLDGCHNDVENMWQALRGCGFETDQIRVLIDRLETCGCSFCAGEEDLVAGAPTRDRILDAMEAMREDTHWGDLAVFYYSGHGSEFSGRGLQVGRRFQTLVPHDSGRGKAPNRDIVDREIEQWIRSFHDTTPYLTLIFDCCHSGGVTDLRSGGPPGRQVVADERPPEGLTEESAGDAEPSSRGASGWLRGAGRSAVVLSASAARELSSETSVKGRKQGLFTHHLTTALTRHGSSDLRWSDIFREVAEGVTAENLSQHPRREGDGPIFAPGPIDLEDVYPPQAIELRRFAVVIGIDYQADQEAQEATGEDSIRRFPPLRTPEADALEMARVLEECQGYEIVGLSSRHPGPLLNEKATRRRIHQLIDRLISAKAANQRDSAVLIYFAGHGLVQADEGGSRAGYLIPWDGDRDDPSTWLAMKDLRDQLVDGIRDRERLDLLQQKSSLDRLTSRHLLLVLDCCFGGALSFDFFRGSESTDRPIYYSEYRRFVEGTAWQLLNSASHNQQAMDRDPKDPESRHSPFAQALIEGLTTDRADAFRSGGLTDHIITATELHQFIDHRLKASGVDIQTPGLTPLRPAEGEFIFHVPGFKPSPLPDPVLDRGANPWPLDSVPAEDLFFGRDLALLGLLGHFLTLRRGGRERGILISGPSGSGATSLVQAGLLPLLRDPIPGRERLRSFLRRTDRIRDLVSRQDLKSVRAWAKDLGIDPWQDSVDEVASKAQAWARVSGGVQESKDLAGEKARMQRESLGLPSFDGDLGKEAMEPWVGRLGLVELLDSPKTLVDWLAYWLERDGLADYVSIPSRGLSRFVGCWKVLEQLPTEEAASEGGSLLVLNEESLAATCPEAWKEFAAGTEHFTLATVRSDFGAGSDLEDRLGDGSIWLPFPLPQPSQEELREVVTGPASARVLFFEPQELVEELVDDARTSPAPLALLSRVLHRMYNRALQRWEGDDRVLRREDLPGGRVAEALAQEAESIWQTLVREDRRHRSILRSLLVRSLSLDGGRPRPRPVPWRELEWVDPDVESGFRERVLPALVAGRILVVDGAQVQWVSPDLAVAWPRWRRMAGALRRVGLEGQGAFRSAQLWEREGFPRSQLAVRDAAARRWVDSPWLNRLERAFLRSSEVEWRAVLMRGLSDRALPELQRRWDTAALLVAIASDLALETQTLIARFLDEAPPGEDPAWCAFEDLAFEVRDLSQVFSLQALLDTLAATPLSVPWRLDSAVSGLAFEEGVLWVRTEAGGVQGLDLQRFVPRESPTPQVPKEGSGRVRPIRRPFRDDQFPAIPLGPLPGPKAQLGHDNSVRYFSAQQRRIPFSHLVKPPQRLLGHKARPTFLAFSKGRRFLASAANLSSGGAEVRVWPVRKPWGLPAHPLALPGKTLKAVFQETDFWSGSDGPWLEAEAQVGSPEPAVGIEADSPDGRWRALGEPDGSVRLQLRGKSEAVAALGRAGEVLLECAREEGFTVIALAFDRQGRRLAIEREAVYEPYPRRVDVYCLDPVLLIRLIRGHVGRGLALDELPPQVWRDLETTLVFSTLEEAVGDDGVVDQERKLYVQTLGLSDSGNP